MRFMPNIKLKSLKPNRKVTGDKGLVPKGKGLWFFLILIDPNRAMAAMADGAWSWPLY